jgi:hypothetical protein
VTIHATDDQARYMVLLTEDEHRALRAVVLDRRSNMPDSEIHNALLAKVLTPLEIVDVCVRKPMTKR